MKFFWAFRLTLILFAHFAYCHFGYVLPGMLKVPKICKLPRSLHIFAISPEK